MVWHEDNVGKLMSRIDLLNSEISDMKCYIKDIALELKKMNEEKL